MDSKKRENEKECVEPEECHGLHSYQCDNLRCAVNKAECNELRLIKKFINSKIFKIDSKSMHNYKKFQDSIKNCDLKPYNLKKIDICLKQNKICYKVIEGQSMVFNLNFFKKPKLAKYLCSCQETSQMYDCNANYCAKDKRSCKEFNRIESMQPKKILKKIKHCEYV